MNEKIVQESESKMVSRYDLLGIQTAFNQCVNTGLKAGTFVAFLELNLQIEQLLLKRSDMLRMLFTSYGIDKPVLVDDGRGGKQLSWEYLKHPKAMEIREKLNAINGEMVELHPCNFIPGDEFHAFMQNSIDGKPIPMFIAFKLSKLLLKDYCVNDNGKVH